MFSFKVYPSPGRDGRDILQVCPEGKDPCWNQFLIHLEYYKMCYIGIGIQHSF